MLKKGIQLEGVCSFPGDGKKEQFLEPLVTLPAGLGYAASPIIPLYAFDQSQREGSDASKVGFCPGKEQ